MVNTYKHIVGLHKIRFNVDNEAMSLIIFKKRPFQVDGRLTMRPYTASNGQLITTYYLLRFKTHTLLIHTSANHVLYY